MEVSAAPAAIAAQLRLRQTGGLVAIDLPRMKPATRKQVDAALIAALATDPRHPEWIGRSRAGMLEVRLPHGRSGPAGYEADKVATSVLTVLRTIARRPPLAAPWPPWAGSTNCPITPGSAVTRTGCDTKT